MESTGLLVEPRLVKKSNSYTVINTSSLTDNNVNNRHSNMSDEEEWCQISPSASGNPNQLVLESGRSYKADKILLYLIDMSIVSGEQIRWKNLVKNIDFTKDPGPIRDFVPIFDEQPSTSSQTELNESANHENIENNNEIEEQDASESIVKALMEYCKNKEDDGNEDLLLIPCVDAPENLLRMYNRLPAAPNEFYIVDGQQIRLRNSAAWRPPKKHFIYELPKLQYDHATMLAMQGRVCAGCGVNLRFHKRQTNFCSYFNKLFCNLCFQGQKARIPARILQKWDFNEYPVSDVAYKFLNENEDQPVFDIHVIDQSLFRKVKNLRLIRSIRLKVGHLWEYIKRCPKASEQTTKYGILRTIFEAIPSRFLSLELNYMYSILDFVSIENGNLIQMLKPLETFGSAHVLKCELCEQRGFLCQICIRPDQIIFPFQLEKIFRCEPCGSLAHLSCYKTRMSKNNVFVCSKCDRIKKKRILQQQPFESSNSD